MKSLLNLLLLAIIALGASGASGISNIQLWPDQSLLVIMTNANPGSYYALETSSDLRIWQTEQTLIVPDVNRKLSATGTQDANHRFFRFIECASGSLSVSSDPATLAPIGIAASGALGVTVGKLPFEAKLENSSLVQVGLKLRYPTGQDIVTLTLWDGATQIGTAVFVGTNTNTVCVFNTRPLVQIGQTKTIVVKADLGLVNIASPGRSGDIISVNYDETRPENTYGVGQISGRNIYASGATYEQGVVLFRSYPMFIPQPISNVGLGDGRLLRFAVTAHAAGDVSLGKWSFLTAGTEASLQSASLYGYTDASFSQPVMGVAISGNIGNATNVTNGTPFSVYAKTANGDPTAIIIPAGQVRYFELRGAFAQPLTSFSILSTSIWTGGDDIIRTAFNYDPVEVFRTGSVVWSPNSYGASMLADQDWFNSWLIPGLGIPGAIQCIRAQ